MHMAGKVAVFLVAAASVGAVLLTSKLIVVRNSWAKKAVTAKTEYQNLLPTVAQDRATLQSTQAKVFRAKQLWGMNFNNVPTAVQQGTGNALIDIGFNNGLLREEDKAGKKITQTLYGFEILPDGTTAYRGDFIVSTVRDNQAQVAPNWHIRPADMTEWQSGKWRWRTQIPMGVYKTTDKIVVPVGHQKNFDEMVTAIGSAHDKLANRQKAKDIQAEMLVKAQEQVKRREAELVGGDELSKEPKADVEHKSGLIAAVEQVEEERNQVLIQIDDLRRRLKVVKSEVDRLQQSNLDLAKKLPQPSESAGTPSVTSKK